MSNAPLMPKATAVWLVENTALTFKQIADLCKLHELEVKGIADGDVALGIKGLDPVTAGQLTRDEIAKGEARSRIPAQAFDFDRGRASGTIQGSALHAGVAARRPAGRHSMAAALPSRNDRCAAHEARRHDEVDDRGDPRPHALELRQHQAGRSGFAGIVHAARSRSRRPEGRTQGRPAGHRASRRLRSSRRAKSIHAEARAAAQPQLERETAKEKEPAFDPDSVFAKLKTLKTDEAE